MLININANAARMKKIMSDLLINLEGEYSREFPQKKALENFAKVMKNDNDNLSINIGRILRWSLHFEQQLEDLLIMLLNPEVYNGEKLQDFFNSRCVPTNVKIELLRNIRKDHEYFKDEIPEKVTNLMNKLRKMSEIRNAFAHGFYAMDLEKGCYYLEYWRGDAVKRDLLSDEYLESIEKLYHEIDELFDIIIGSLPDKAWKYYRYPQP
jgi:hypothetical protein